jgi:hypothetical protein
MTFCDIEGIVYTTGGLCVATPLVINISAVSEQGFWVHTTRAMEKAPLASARA